MTSLIVTTTRDFVETPATWTSPLPHLAGIEYPIVGGLERVYADGKVVFICAACPDRAFGTVMGLRNHVGAAHTDRKTRPITTNPRSVAAALRDLASKLEAQPRPEPLKTDATKVDASWKNRALNAERQLTQLRRLLAGGEK